MNDVIQIGPQQAPQSDVIPLFGVQPVRPPRLVDRDTVLYSAVTGQPAEQVEPAVQQGMTAGFNMQVDAAVRTALSAEVEQIVAEETENPDELIFDAIEGMRELDTLRRFFPESVTAALRSGTPGAREFALDRLAKGSILSERIEERLQGMDSWGQFFLNFGELLVDPLYIVHLNTFRGLVERTEALFAPGVSVEDFRTGFQQILAEAEDAGFLSDSNRFYFAGFLQMLGTGIYSNETKLEELMGWADIGFTGALDAAPAVAFATRRARAQRAVQTATNIPAGVVPRGVEGAVRDAVRDPVSLMTLVRPTPQTDETVAAAIQRAVSLDDPQRSSVAPTLHTEVSAATPTSMRGGMLSAAGHRFARDFELRSRYLNELKSVAYNSGRVFDDETLNAFAEVFRADRVRFLRASGRSRIIDVEIGPQTVDEFNNLFAVDIKGTYRGDYFRTARAAEKAAEFGDEVVQVGEGQYALISRQNIPVDNLNMLRELGYGGSIRGMMLYRTVNPEELGDGIFARFGSPGAQADPNIVNRLFQGEGQFNRYVQEVQKSWASWMRGMKGHEIAEVFSAFDHMASLTRKSAFTEDEFRAYIAEVTKREATDAQVRLYLEWQELMDAQVFHNADVVFKQNVTAGARAFQVGDTEYIVAPVSRDRLDATNMVYDADNQRVVRFSELPEDAVIFRNQDTDDLPGDVQYLTSMTPRTRAVRHSDFLARNSGAHRAYEVADMQFIAKQENVKTYADGSTRGLPPRSLFAGRTREEVEAGVTAFNNVVQAIDDQIRRGLTPTGQPRARGEISLDVWARMDDDEFFNLLEGFKGNRALNEAIQNNNAWNKSISSVEDLIQYAKDRAVNLRRPAEIVGEGQPLKTMASLEDALFVPRGMTHGEETMFSLMRGGRGAEALPKVGGGTIRTRSTREVLEASYITTVAKASETAFRLRAGNGLLKAILDSGVISKENWSKISNLPLRTQLEMIKREGMIDTTGAKGASANVGRRLQLDLDRLLFRMERQSATQRAWNDITRVSANFLYGRGFTWAAHKIDRWSTDPISALRGWAFDVYLGFFNPVQFFMQGVQGVNIMAIGGMRGVQGVILGSLLRLVLNNPSAPLRRRIIDQVGTTFGLEVADLDLMVEMFKKTGRNVVDNNVAEMSFAEDAASRSRVGAVINETRDFGRIPYRQGELMARFGAFSTSYLEYIDKFGRRPRGVNDWHARNWMTNREQVLTQYMTSASRQGYEQLPFMQFMTYSLRVYEALFAGTFSNTKSVLTKAEKLRFGMTHLALFGAFATVPTKLLMDYITFNYQIEDGSIQEQALMIARRGFADALVEYVTGVDTAISSRFSSQGMLYDMLEQLSTESLWTVLAGPAGQMTGQFTTSTLSVINGGLASASSGTIDPLRAGISDFARSFSSGNNLYNAYSAYRFGRHITRNGTLIAEDLTFGDSVAMAFGVPVDEVDAAYGIMQQRNIRTAWLEAVVVRGLNRQYGRMNEAIRRNNIDEASRIMAQINMAIIALDPWERQIVQRRLRDSPRALNDQLMIEMIQRDVQAQEFIR